MYGGAYGQGLGGVPGYPPLLGGPGGGGGHIGAGFPGGAQGFTGGAQRIPPRAGRFEELPTLSDKEELEGVNRVVRRLFQRVKDQRLDGAQEGHEILSNKPKHTLAEGHMKRGVKSGLELYLACKLGSPDTPFHPEVKKEVVKEYPGFYKKYKDKEAVQSAMDTWNVYWPSTP